MRLQWLENVVPLMVRMQTRVLRFMSGVPLSPEKRTSLPAGNINRLRQHLKQHNEEAPQYRIK
ncbi:hypothetical protein E2C01_071516 [Portunus trituberculatus]|uniref:Uncharacterized protein n=1 Tax=Portunus trituberculatus TaxID=210409 RepID=A0A5B7I053_PORTR|nr:hypothetical protein [Portunus trituberculatus]